MISTYLNHHHQKMESTDLNMIYERFGRDALVRPDLY